MKPHVLVSNDDGICSGFLQVLVDALRAEFKVSVAAPKREQSWIGRAISRHSEITVENESRLFPEGVQAWAIDGTPSDCVNIALGNLLNAPPQIVVSGINLGYNTSEILILSSGTIAGAIEGSMWGLPSIAFSQAIPHPLFEKIHAKGGQTEGNFASVIAASANRAREITAQSLENPPIPGTVLNVNFPDTMHPKAITEYTRPSKIQLGSLYELNANGKYRFRYSEGTRTCKNPNSDRDALKRGHVSISELDFSAIGKKT